MTRRIFITEELTAAIASQHAATIARADACSAVYARDGMLATRLTDDPRWRHGSSTEMWELATRPLMNWTRPLVERQGASLGFSRIERALMTAGLEGRLRVAGLTCDLYNRSARALGGQDFALDLVTDDPYARDAAARANWLTPAPHTRSVQPGSLMAALGRITRERVLASALWTRDPGPARSERHLPVASGKRTALFMAVSRRGVRHMRRIIDELRGRDWNIVIVHYGRSMSDPQVALPYLEGALVPFEQVSCGWQVPDPKPNAWLLDGDNGPLSRDWLRLALDATRTSTRVQVAQHFRMLTDLAPSVVFGHGADVTGMALHAAALQLGIPTVFVAHGYQHSGRAFYYFFNTAAATFGTACVEVNRSSYDGQAFEGLVATGHPPHDDMALALGEGPRHRIELPGLKPPVGRPRIVVGLASWGPDLLSHHQQKEFFRLVARNLPADAYFVCKLHPAAEERALCESVLAENLPREAYRVVGEREFTTLDLLRASDVAVSSERSMVLVDAIVVGCPAIAVHQPEIPMGVSDRAHPGKDYSQNCLIATDGPQLRAAIEALTRDEGVRARLQAARAGYLQRFLRIDGRAASRIADLASHLAEGGTTASFSG